MEINAFTGGVSPDGLKNKTHIKVLVCYMLCNCSEPMKADDITSICFDRELANYFEVCDAIYNLENDGIIVRDEKTGVLSPTDDAKQIVGTLGQDLPRTVLENTLEELTRFEKLKRHEKDTRVTIEDRDDGGCNITCTTFSGDLEMMSVSLYVPSRRYALEAKERFLDDPARIYKYLLSYFTGSKM